MGGLTLEAALIGRRVSLLVILAGRSEEALGRVKRHPAFESYFAGPVVGRLGVQLGPAVAALHHRPGVGGGLGVVNDEQAYTAANKRGFKGKAAQKS